MVSKSTMQILVVALVGVLALSAVGYINFADFIPTTPEEPTTPPATVVPGVTTPGVTPDVIMAAKAQWSIRDAITKTATASGDTAYVGICKAVSGRFDLLSPMEETEFDGDPDTSSRTYSTGDELLIAVSSDNDPTGGNETYPRWFYIQNLQHGAPLKALPLGDPISALTAYKSGSTYTYSVSGSKCEAFGTIIWQEAATPYWDFGVFEVYGRVGKQNIIQQFTAAGVVLTTFNDGATWEDTDAEINANHTMTADKEDINFEMIAEVNDVAWGLPFLAVSATGEVSQYSAVLVVTTAALGINTAELYQDGWQPLTKPDLTADLGFYYVISTEGVPKANGDKFSISIPFTIEDSGLAASTAFDMEGWALDAQKEANVARGSTTTSLPGNNGFISDLGIDANIQPLALTVSSGSAATMQLLFEFTTNA